MNRVNEITAVMLKLENEKKIIAESRNRLYELIEEAKMLEENCDSAKEDLQSAIDALSELV